MILAVCFSILSHYNYRRNLSSELDKRGRILSLGISSSVQRALLTGNLARIKYIADLYETLDPDIIYVVISDNRGRVVYHTFKGGLPRDLKALLSEGMEEDVLINTESGLVKNIPGKILGGEAGVAYIGLSEERIREQMQANLRTILLIVLLVGGAGIAVILRLSRSVTQPINEVIHAAREFGSGVYTHKIPVNTADETGQLATAFNRMAEEITDHQKKILQAEKLAAIGRLAAGVAHEINNPIMGIRNCVDLIGSPPASPDKDRKYKALISENLSGMENVVRNLLSFSRTREEEKRYFMPQDVIRSTSDFLSRIAEKKQVSFVYESCDHCLPVFGSPNELQQVVMNIFMNAIDAMPEGGRVVVSADCQPGMDFVKVKIRDTGTGIPKEQLDNIFEPFFTTKDPGRGTGLGLYVCHQIIAGMGGAIEVDSRIGAGTEFTIRLPVAGKDQT